MKYELVAASELQEIYHLVQHTIKTIYPKYYPEEVVRFFCRLHSCEAILKDIENNCVSVLKVDGKIVGTGSLIEDHITRVYVLPEYQKKGYGAFMISSMEAGMAPAYKSAYLDASLPAAVFYEKLGYHTIKHENYPVENEVILVYEIMEKRLSASGMRINCNGKYFTCKKASINDIDELVKTRVIVLRAANHLEEDEDMSEVEKESYEYYQRALPAGRHTAYLVYDEEDFIGAGGVSFYQVLPTYHNPGGRKAYIMNMYTAPKYRRCGIAYQLLDLLVKEAWERGITQISLEATKMGKPLYQKYGFVKMEDEMELRVLPDRAGGILDEKTLH